MDTLRTIIERTCTNKVEMSEEEANQTIERFAQKGRIMYFYRCPFCSRFHVTRQTGTVQHIEVIGGNNEKRNMVK